MHNGCNATRPCITHNVALITIVTVTHEEVKKRSQTKWRHSDICYFLTKEEEVGIGHES